MRRYRLYLVISLMICYEMLVRIIAKPIIFPSLFLIFNELINILFSSSFLFIVSATLSRTLGTFFVVLVLSLSLGILSGYCKVIQSLLIPIVTFLRAIPTITITIILLIWFGRELGPLIIMGLVVFPILYELVVGAMNEVDGDLLDVCLLFGATPFEKFKALYYPQLLKMLSSGLQVTIGLSFKVMVMAEVMAQSNVGIGQRLNYEKTYLNMPAVFAWTLVLIVMVVVFEVIIGCLMRVMIRHLDS